MPEPDVASLQDHHALPTIRSCNAQTCRFIPKEFKGSLTLQGWKNPNPDSCFSSKNIETLNNSHNSRRHGNGETRTTRTDQPTLESRTNKTSHHENCRNTRVSLATHAVFLGDQPQARGGCLVPHHVTLNMPVWVTLVTFCAHTWCSLITVHMGLKLHSLFTQMPTAHRNSAWLVCLSCKNIEFLHHIFNGFAVVCSWIFWEQPTNVIMFSASRWWFNSTYGPTKLWYLCWPVGGNSFSPLCHLCRDTTQQNTLQK